MPDIIEKMISIFVEERVARAHEMINAKSPEGKDALDFGMDFAEEMAKSEGSESEHLQAIFDSNPNLEGLSESLKRWVEIYRLVDDTNDESKQKFRALIRSNIDQKLKKVLPWMDEKKVQNNTE